MQKFHHWPEFNNSSVFKCLDNGHCDCTSMQFKTSTVHHWTVFATKTTQIKECALMLDRPCALVSDDEWWTAEDGYILFTLHFHTGTVCLSASDNADTYAPPWASTVVSGKPSASRAHACHTYTAESLLRHACMACKDRCKILASYREAQSTKNLWILFKGSAQPSSPQTLKDTYAYLRHYWCSAQSVVLGIVPLDLKIQRNLDPFIIGSYPFS